MMRKLAVALSLASVLGAGVVQALGLGEASVKSTLNQPLKAEIELVNVRDLENNEILPGLASREEFLKAGVERIYFLSDVRFEVQRNSEGKMVVNLTTTKPVREPFLNFLVEVIWPSGRLLREYALLIDPPIYGEEPLAAVQKAVTAPTRTEPATSVDQSRVAVTDQPEMVSTDAERTPMGRDVSGGVESYGPTTDKDTMWAIALKVRPDNTVTPQQTMLAIQDLNPDSFINNNINSLKKGQILRLPSLNDIRQRSKREAVRGVIAQNRDFENRALGKAIVDATAGEEAAPVSQPVRTGDELKLVVAESDVTPKQSGAHAGEAATEGDADSLKNDLAVTLEKLDQSILEKEELNSRVNDLEEQLETLQRLLTLKDDQLANLQAQMAKEKTQQPLEVIPQQVEPPLDEVVDDKVDEEVLPEEAKPPVEADEIVAEKTDVVESKEVAPAPVVATPVEPVKAPEPKKLTMQSVIDMVLNNPLYQAVAGGVVILVLLLVWALSRRNAQKEKEFFETRNEQGEEPGDIFDTDETVEVGEAVATLALDDEAVDETEEEVVPLQSETEDVIAEADIYIAYGRLDQAAQLLENAISSEPQRTDIRIKLLEVYAESKEVEAFDKQFNEIAALNDDYAMEQANSIRAKIEEPEDILSIDELESQLLSESPEKPEDSGMIDFEPVEAEEPKETASEDVVNIDEELSELEAELELDSEALSESLETEEDNLDIDFDISEIDLDAGELSLEEESEAIELALDEGERDETISLGEEVESESAEESLLDEIESLDAGLDEALEELEEGMEAEDVLALDDMETLPGESIESFEEELADIDSDLSKADLELEIADQTASDELLSLEGVETDQTLSEELSEELSDEFDIDFENETSLEDLELGEQESVDEISEEALNFDDLDLELDKIDSELDVDFDLDLEPVSSSDETELTELESVVDELESVADTLSEDDETLLESAETVESVEQEESIVDDSILEQAEESVEEIDDFEADLADDEDFDFLAGTDEAATKLDLARAYIDMGDSDGAKDILEEVAIEGSDQQKQEAQDLLKTLD